MPNQTPEPPRVTDGQIAEWERDSERLIWMQVNDASFGTSDRFLGVDGGEAKWAEARFVRVPCRHLMEWHCYDGATWRDAIDAAMEAWPCAASKTRGCTNGRFAPTEYDHPYEQALREQADVIERLQAENEELKPRPCRYCEKPAEQTMRFLPASKQMQCPNCLRVMPFNAIASATP